ncbi:MAG: hypothetical protein RRZ71_02585 [Clostridia bacterium]
MRKSSMQIIALTLVAAIVAGTASVSFATTRKDEVVYVEMENSGAPAAAYVVNEFYMSAPGTITDCGAYDKVTNLTNMEAISLDGSSITANAQAGRFYYQGDLSGGLQLPWLIVLNWTLNGAPATTEQLVGASGKVGLTIDITRNAASATTFFDSFVLQGTVTLDGAKCSNIIATDATVASAGSNKLITIMSLPKSESHYSITADVVNFSMTPIQFAGIPLNMPMGDIATDEFTDSIAELQDGIAQLDDGAQALEKGIGKFSSGVGELKGGVGELKGGMDQLANNGGKLTSGAKGLADGVLAMVNAQLAGSGVPTLTWKNYQSELGKLAGVTDEMRAQAKQGIAASTGLSGEDLNLLIYLANSELTSSKPTADDCNTALSSAGALLLDAGKAGAAGQMLQTAAGEPWSVASVQQALKISTAEAYGQFIQGIMAQNPSLTAESAALFTVIAANEMGSGAAQDVAFASAGRILNSAAKVQSAGTPTAAGVTAFLTKLVLASAGDSIKQAAQLLSMLTGFDDFRSGLGQYVGGVGQASGGMDQLLDGVNELYKGSKDLKSGMGKLADGTGELRNSTGDMDEQIDTAIDNILAEYSSDGELTSFVDPTNANVNSVQFVMMTKGIDAPAADVVVAEKAETTFWSRLLALFGIGK